MAQYVFTMNRVGKIVPPKRQILKDISLSFFPGAKIGVLGLNGSGKSTLLKIMAGVDKEIEGEATPMPGLKIGYLPQEPQLDPEQTVREAVEEGIGGVLAAKKRSSTRSMPPTPSPTPTSTRSPPSRPSSRRMIAAAGSENTEHAARDRRRRAAPAAVGRHDRQAVGRREAPRRAVPPAAVQARHAAARRADQPPGRRIGRVARAVPARASPAPWSPSPTTATSSTTPPNGSSNSTAASGIPWKGNYSTWLEQKEAAPGAGAEDRRRPHQGDEEGAGVGAPEPQGPPGQEQGAPGPLRGAVRRRIPEAQRDQRDLHPGGRAPGQRGDRVQERQQELRRPRC